MPGKNYSLRQKIWALSLIILSLFLLYYLIRSIWAPLDKKREIEDRTFADSLFIQKTLIISSDPGLVLLSKELAYRKAILRTVKSDSIIFYLNLSDSTAGLMLNGTVLHSVKMGSYEIDPLLTSVSFQAYLKNFSIPQSIVNEKSSLVKEPVITRKAPSSPEEAAQSVYLPDTLQRDPAYAMLKLNSGIDLFLEQTERQNRNDRKARFAFRHDQRMQLLSAGFSGFFNFETSNYRPSIHLYMPGEDIRVIYRALPENGNVILRY
jgi:hypothetical protein